MGKMMTVQLAITILVFVFSGCKKDVSEPFLKDFDPTIHGDYFVSNSENASDYNPGTYEQPFASMQRAIEVAQPGDTVYIKGGVYYPESTIVMRPRNNIGTNGTSSTYIKYFNYPGDKPIFDFINCEPNGNYNGGLFLDGVHFIHLKGFTIRNVKQKRENVEVIGTAASGSSNLIYENITVHNCDGNAFRYDGAFGYHEIPYDSAFYINCDAYNCCDSLPRETGATIGGAADGFKTWNEPGAYFHFEGCRAWNCSDDGFDPGTDPVTVINNCWSFRNGYLDGDGAAFKTGGMWHDNGEIVTRIVTNCIAAECKTGFFLLEYPDYYRTNARFYNNFSYAQDGNGFSISRNQDHPEVLGIWRNNVSYKNGQFPFMNSYQFYTEDHNTWDIGSSYHGEDTDSLTLTDSDFLSLDIDELTKSRKPDGSLPNIIFGKLAEDSDLKNMGVYIGMSKDPNIGIDWDYIESVNSIPDFSLVEKMK